MSSDYGSKKQYGKQKTYGKAVKSHLNGWFGRSLWAEVEPAKEVNSKASGSQSSSSKAAAREKKAPASDSDSSSESETESVPLRVTAKASASSDADTVSTQFSVLAISDDAHFAALVERRTSLVIAQELHTQSSLSSLPESSDKENEAAATESTASSTPRKLSRDWEPMEVPETTPRHVLGERDSLSIKESPPRKRGLRKRSSVGTAAPSPLKNEAFAAGDSVPQQEPWEDSIHVWEDSTQGKPFVDGEPSKAPADNDDTPVRRTRSRTKEQEPESFYTPAKPTDHLEELDVSEVTRSLEPPPIPVPAIESPKPSPPVCTGSPFVDDSDSGHSGSSDYTDQPQSSQATENSIITETEQLLRLCTENSIVDFTTHIDAQGEKSEIRKLGEASYSEVFLQSSADCDSTIVLKIIPFGKEEQCEVKSIIQEVRITKAMDEIEGFIGFRG